MPRKRESRRGEVRGKGWESQSTTLAELPLLSWGWIKGVAGEGVETTLAAENSHQPTANKEVRSTVLRPPATQFYKQDEWSWKEVHPWNPNKDAHLMSSSRQPLETRVENKPSQTDTWPTEPCKYCILTSMKEMTESAEDHGMQWANVVSLGQKIIKLQIKFIYFKT